MAAAAPGIVAPNVRDPDALAGTLVSWFGARKADALDIAITKLSNPLGAGMSHETNLFDAASREGAAERAQGHAPADQADAQHRLPRRSVRPAVPPGPVAVWAWRGQSGAAAVVRC